MKNKNHIVSIIAVCFLFFLPFLINPQIITQKDNDLGRTYIPLFTFIKESLVQEKQIPLWRPDQFMGETFAGNPLSSLFYPPNLIFAVAQVETASVIYFLFHFMLASVSTFLLARNFGLSKDSSFAAAFFYGFSTKMIAHFTAGHITMIAAFSYFPFVLLGIEKLLNKKSPKWLLISSLSLASMYISYPTIFYYASIFLGAYIIFSFLFLKKRFKNVLISVTALIAGVSLSAVALIPHLEFAPLSTRNSLTLNDVATPIWNAGKFLKSLMFPYSNLPGVGHEELLYLGIVPTVFFAIGFFYLKTSLKIALAVFLVLSVFFAAGLSTPLFPLAYEHLPLLKYSRVTTRFWFIIALVVALVASYGIDKIRNRKVTFLAILIFLSEISFIGITKINSTPNLNFGRKDLYQLLSQDKEIFRVYCTSNCFNPQQLSAYGIRILNGENPIQQKETVEFLERAGNYEFKNFAVIFPPYQIWQTEFPPQPNAEILGSAGVKYVLSTYKLNSNDFKEQQEFDGIFLYQNSKFRELARFQDSSDKVKISRYSPNKINFQFARSNNPRTLILADSFYPGWESSSKKEVLKQEPLFRKIIIDPNTEKVDFVYNPKSLKAGATISLFTLLVLAIHFWYPHMKRN